MPSGAGGTQTSPATLHHLQNPKWPVWGPKWQTGTGKASTRLINISPKCFANMNPCFSFKVVLPSLVPAPNQINFN